MPSINNSLNGVHAAETRRGLVLEHRGSSSLAEIANNAGTVAGTACSYPDILNVKTVIAKLKVAQAGSSTVKINSSQTITITAGNLFGSYDNATAFNADDIIITDYSKFEYVKVFRFQLSTEEKAAYQAGTMWQYMGNAVLIMDGKLNSYDPDNVRVLDRSGKGNHFTITGADKLSTRGYDFISTNSDTMTLNKRLSTATKGSIVFILKPDNIATNQQSVILAYGSVNTNPLFKIQYDETLGADTKRYLFVTGNLAGASLNLITWPMTNQLNDRFVHLSSNASRYRLRENGTELTPTVATGSNNGKWVDNFNDPAGVTDIGSQLFGASRANFLDGIIKYLAFFEEELNVMQEIDLRLSINPNTKE